MPVKRKANAMGQLDATTSGMLPSTKRCGAIKSAEGKRSMEGFLNDLYTHECEADSFKSETFAVIKNSPMLMKAMLKCHEQFVRVVASELAVVVVTETTTIPDSNETSNTTTVHRIGDHHVQKTLNKLGMPNLYSEMKQIQKTVGSAVKRTAVAPLVPSKAQRKNERRTKQWTDEEIFEQESLLASSKEKLLRGGD